MKSILGQRVYIGSTDSSDLVDDFDLYLEGLCDGEHSIRGSGALSVLKAGESILAYVKNEKWAEELVDLLETFHKREMALQKQIEDLCDEVNSLRAVRAVEAELQAGINERLGV